VLSRFGTPHLLVAVTLLVGSGLVMVYSASAARSDVYYGVTWALALRQLGGAGLGVLALVAASRLPLEWLERAAWACWAAGVLGIALTLGPLGVDVNNATRWLALGPVTFQPLEPAKLAVIIGVSHWLAAHSDRMQDFRFAVLVPLAMAALPAALLLEQPDFGGAVTLLLLTGALVFAAGARLSHLAFVAALAVPVLALVAGMSPYRLRRLEMFLDPWADPLGNGYQLVQSQLAFGAGGLTGAGLGAGQQKLFYLPEAHTDFILSVIGEETGLVGVAGVIVCFAVVAISTLGIAARASSGFATLLALGCGLMLWLQAGLNAGVAMGALPTKGTTLPLLSYGSTSLVSSLAAVGLILNVARPRQRGRSGWR
jgi:cell division protein FtsW